MAVVLKIPAVKAVKPLEDYRLAVIYENGERRIFDARPYLHGNWFGMLLDMEQFRTVHPDGNTVSWADGQDIAPHELYELSVPET